MKTSIDKVAIEITGEIQKEKDEDFTEEEREKFGDDFIDWIESKGLLFTGVIM